MSYGSGYAYFSNWLQMPGSRQGGKAVRTEFVADLAAEALFGESSDLYQRLYEEGKIDASFGGGFETVSAMGMLTVSGDSDYPEEVRKALINEAKKICHEGISEDRLLRMKRSAIGRRIRALDSFNSLIFRITAYYFTDFDYFEFPAIYEKITPQELTDFLFATVREENCAMSVIYPTSQKEEL